MCTQRISAQLVYSFLLHSFVILSLRASSEGNVPSNEFKACKLPSDGGDREGICINLEHEVIRCTSLRKVLLAWNFTGIRSAVCDEPQPGKFNETSVCCPVDEYVELYPGMDDSLETHANFKLIPNIKESECGRSFGSTNDRIIGGNDVPPGTHPWMARLGIVLPDEDEIRFLCSGSIINERYILTASHCFKHGELRVIRLAETNEEAKEECVEVGVDKHICQEVEDYEPENVIVHRNYSKTVGSANDIALIRLKQPIRNLSSPFTRPVCLPFISDFQLPDLENIAVSATGAKNLMHVQGWGKESNEDTVGTVQLKEVLVPLRSNIYCRHIFRRNNLSISDDQMCAGGTKNKGSCSGDSGSPLLMYGHTSDKPGDIRMFQIGIVSYGRRQCGLENAPVVYTRVRSFLKWLLDNIRE